MDAMGSRARIELSRRCETTSLLILRGRQRASLRTPKLWFLAQLSVHQAVLARIQSLCGVQDRQCQLSHLWIAEGCMQNRVPAAVSTIRDIGGRPLDRQIWQIGRHAWKGVPADCSETAFNF